MKLSPSVQEFFKENNIDPNEFLETDPEIVLEAFDPEIREIARLVKSIESTNNQHKLLFAAGLIETRMQVKKVQEQIATLQKQIQRDIKDFSERIENKIDSSNDTTINRISSLIRGLREIIYSLFKNSNKS